MTITLIGLAILIAAGVVAIVVLLREDLRDVAHRGEVAEAPQQQLPRDKTCPINATPHWCCDPAEWLPPVPYGTGESLARELTDYLRSVR